MPTLTLTPTTTAPGSNLKIDGSGFDPARKVQLALDGSGWTTNYLRPAADGTFHVGVNVATSPKAQVVSARYADATKVTVARATVVVAKPAPPPVDPPPAAGPWFGGRPDPWAGMAFGSFPLAPAGQMWISGDQGGRTISRLYFKDRPAGQNVIVLMNAINLKLDLIDFDGVPEGIYAQDCSDIEISRIRVGGKGIFGPFTRTGFHSGNLWQVIRSKRFHIHDVKGEQPATAPSSPAEWGTEDAMHQGGDPGAWGGDSWERPFLIERVAFYGGGWESHSGTGLFVGDGASGKYVWIRDVVLYDPGRVGMGTGEEGPYRLEDARFYGNGRGVAGIEQRSDRWEFNRVRVAGFGVPWVGGTPLGGYPAGWGTRYTKDGVFKTGDGRDFASSFTVAELAEMRALTRVAP